MTIICKKVKFLGNMTELQEKRIELLENSTNKSLDILQKIEKRLVGDIEKETIGLIQEVKLISKQVVENQLDIDKLKDENVKITNDIKIYNNLQADIKVLKELVDDLNKNKWLIQGGLIVIGIIIGKIDWIWKLIFK